jgi:hypothetical protein
MHPMTEIEHFGDRDTLLARLPDMIAASRVRDRSVAAVVLLEQQGLEQDSAPQAALVHQQVGQQGRVAAVLTDGLWQWAMLPSRLDAYDSVHQVFWSRLTRWLAMGGQFVPGNDIALTLARQATRPGDSLEIHVAARRDGAIDERTRLEAVSPIGHVQQLDLQRVSDDVPRWKASVSPQTPGVHRLRLVQSGKNGEATVAEERLAVQDASLERFDPTARPHVLRELAQATGGQCLALGEADELVKALRTLEKTRSVHRRIEPAFNDPTVVGALILLLACEWYVRRRMGMA